MKLLTRTTLTFLAYAGAVLLAGTFVFYGVIRELNSRDVDEALRLRRAQVVRQLAALRDPADLALWMRLDEDLELRPLTGHPPLVAERITAVMGYDSLEREAEPQRQLEARVLYRGRPYRLLLRRSLVENDELLSGLAVAQAILLTVLLGGMLGLQTALARRLWRPFYHTLAQLRHYRLDAPPAAGPVTFVPTRIQEFAELHAALAQLLDHSQRVYRSQREFTENASHELQTPLAVLRSKLELLTQTADLTEEQAGYLDAALTVVRRLAHLNRSLLLLTRLDSQPGAAGEWLALPEVVRAHLAQLHEQIAVRELTLETDLAADVRVQAPRALFDMLLSNLLTNAIRHNQPGGSIGVRLTPQELRIENTGRPKPLPADQLFTRFNRDADNATGGVGLGLAIAQQASVRCGFTLRYAYPAEGRHALIVGFPPRSV